MSIKLYFERKAVLTHVARCFFKKIFTRTYSNLLLKEVQFFANIMWKYLNGPGVLQHIMATVSVPLVVDSSIIFMLASNPENNGMSPVQTTVINTLHSTSKLILEGDTSASNDYVLLPSMFSLLVTLSTFSCEMRPFAAACIKCKLIDLNVPSSYKNTTNIANSATAIEHVQISCNIFSERCLRHTVDLYTKTASHPRLV